MEHSVPSIKYVDKVNICFSLNLVVRIKLKKKTWIMKIIVKKVLNFEVHFEKN